MPVINGQNCSYTVGMTLSEYLEKNKYAANRIAIEYNGDILSKKDYPSTVINENDKIEIVTFMGGG